MMADVAAGMVCVGLRDLCANRRWSEWGAGMSVVGQLRSATIWLVEGAG
jgi:hypothetical protein